MEVEELPDRASRDRGGVADQARRPVEVQVLDRAGRARFRARLSQRLRIGELVQFDGRGLLKWVRPRTGVDRAAFVFMDKLIVLETERSRFFTNLDRARDPRSRRTTTGDGDTVLF